ncbi:MAG: adenylate kinase [bacterium]
MVNSIIFGAPGAGKGTQCKMLSESLGLIHISTGVLIREEIAKGSEIGIRAKLIIEKGFLLDDETVSKIFLNSLKRHPDSPGFLFDGFPRTAKQTVMLENILNDLNMELNFFIELTLPTDEAVKRLLKRAEIEGRSDDNLKTVKARFEEYNEKTAPVKDYYVKKGIYRSVDGAGKAEEVNLKLRSFFL